MSEAIIQINQLQKRFGNNEVLKNVDFDVHHKEVVVLIGASGSGKSTLLRCINLLEEPSGGEILFHGENIQTDQFSKLQYCAKVGMVFQQFNLFNNMTVLKNCTYAQEKVLKRSHEEAEATAKRHLQEVGMLEFANALPRQLSGGQKQRVAIARA